MTENGEKSHAPMIGTGLRSEKGLKKPRGQEQRGGIEARKGWKSHTFENGTGYISKEM